MAFLETAGTILSLANSAKSLFGGSSDQGDSMKSQYAWNALSTLNNPLFQVRGLRKAGLNPMLAVGKGIAPAPTVTAAPGADEANRISRDQQRVASALAMAQIANTEANTEKAKAETANVNVNSARQANEIEVLKQEVPLKNAQHNLTQAQSGLVGQQNIESHERSQLLVQQVTQSKADTARSMAETSKAIAARDYTLVEIQSAQEMLKGQLLEGKIDETKFGDAMRHLKRLSQSITGLGGVGRQLTRP